MDKTFQKFLRTGIDLSSVGVERCAENEPYFCTPKGASIFGWAGVDGIHFCFVRGFGSMVFAVDPANPYPDYVHPLAKNFSDFLRLLLACGDVAALEQAWMWDETQFETFLQENHPTQAQQETLALVAAALKLTPMEQPWAYIKELQTAFDDRKIKYTEAYYRVVNPDAGPTVPAWKVYFEGNFWEHTGKDRAGTEIRLDKQWEWAGRHWVIPAAYACSKGLVLDLCMRTPAEDIRKFRKKWDLNHEDSACVNFTQEQKLQMDADDPRCFDILPRLELNGKTSQLAHGCSVFFDPCSPDEMMDGSEAKWVVDHYGLDASDGWMIFRAAFPWTSSRRPEITSLSLTMAQQPCWMPGPHFKVHAPGDQIVFSHPVSGTEYTLTVQELEPQTLPQSSFGSSRYFYPSHFIAMRYTLSPEATEDISICDCCDSDKPVEIVPRNERFAPEAQNDVICTGIIGGAGKPTTILLENGSQSKLRTACSSLRFEPIQEDTVEWGVTFSAKHFEDATFTLL